MKKSWHCKVCIIFTPLLYFDKVFPSSNIELHLEKHVFLKWHWAPSTFHVIQFQLTRFNFLCNNFFFEIRRYAFVTTFREIFYGMPIWMWFQKNVGISSKAISFRHWKTAPDKDLNSKWSSLDNLYKYPYSTLLLEINRYRRLEFFFAPLFVLKRHAPLLWQVSFGILRDDQSWACSRK